MSYISEIGNVDCETKKDLPFASCVARDLAAQDPAWLVRAHAHWDQNLATHIKDFSCQKVREAAPDFVARVGRQMYARGFNFEHFKAHLVKDGWDGPAAITEAKGRTYRSTWEMGGSA